MRLAYIKFNNGVDELRRVLASNGVLDDGGAEAYVANIVKYAGDNRLLILSFHGDNPPLLTYQDGNVSAISYSWPSRASLTSIVKRVWQSLRMVWQLTKFQPTHIYCWENNIPLWLAYIYARMGHAKFVSSVHTRLSNEGSTILNRLRTVGDNLVLRKSDSIICHGPYLKSQLLAIGVPDNRVIEFGWAYKSFLNNAKRDHEEDTQTTRVKKIYYVGRVYILKGIFDLFEAMKPIMRNTVDVQLVYVGDGPDLEELQERVMYEGYEERVTFLGKVPYEALAGTISDGYVVVTPTRSRFPEGRCMAAIEAILLGIPLVAPNSGPFPYIIEHEQQGLLFDTDNVASLRDALEHIITNEDFRNRCAIAAHIKGDYLRNPEMTFYKAIDRALS